MSDEFPGKKMFNLLSENSNNEETHFIPLDWTPIQTNQELIELMVGKPQHKLPILNNNFPDTISLLDVKALDLLFAYRTALKMQKAIVVLMNNSITASTVSKFMNLLPASLAEETTFVINHQTDSYAKDVKISFINEFYKYTIYPNLCTYINLMDNSRLVDDIEKIWRPILEQVLSNNDYLEAERLTNWIFSNIADENVGSSVNLNEALYYYSQNPSKFTLNTIDEVENILEVIGKYVRQGNITSEHLNSLVIKLVDNALELDHFVKAIDYCMLM